MSRTTFSTRQGAWGRITATLHEEPIMFERLYNTRVSRHRQGQLLVEASPEAHTITPRSAAIQGVLPMTCEVCGETFGMVNAVASINERNAGVHYYCKAHRENG